MLYELIFLGQPDTQFLILIIIGFSAFNTMFGVLVVVFYDSYRRDSTLWKSNKDAVVASCRSGGERLFINFDENSMLLEVSTH